MHGVELHVPRFVQQRTANPFLRASTIPFLELIAVHSGWLFGVWFSKQPSIVK
jgi:hypothetical protein